MISREIAMELTEIKSAKFFLSVTPDVLVKICMWGHMTDMELETIKKLYKGMENADSLLSSINRIDEFKGFSCTENVYRTALIYILNVKYKIDIKYMAYLTSVELDTFATNVAESKEINIGNNLSIDRFAELIQPKKK